MLCIRNVLYASPRHRVIDTTPIRQTTKLVFKSRVSSKLGLAFFQANVISIPHLKSLTPEYHTVNSTLSLKRLLSLFIPSLSTKHVPLLVNKFRSFSLEL